jgi:hypothetical protein
MEAITSSSNDDTSNRNYKGWTITRKGGPRRVQITRDGEAHIFHHWTQAIAYIDGLDPGAKK